LDESEPVSTKFLGKGTRFFFRLHFFRAKNESRRRIPEEWRKAKPGGAFQRMQPEEFLKEKDLGGKIKKTVLPTVFDRGFPWDEKQMPGIRSVFSP